MPRLLNIFLFGLLRGGGTLNQNLRVRSRFLHVLHQMGEGRGEMGSEKSDFVSKMSTNKTSDDGEGGSKRLKII